MHILLTDILTCPRCGPAFGLILLADRAEERRVLEGVLGCSNCREKYPVRDGVVDFGVTPEAVAPADDPVAAERLAAIMGVAEGPAFLLLVGPATGHAAAIAGMIAEVEVLTIGALANGDERPGINRIYAGAPQLPIASGKVAAVALTGDGVGALLDEAARVVSPLGRLVLDPVPADAAERLKRHGMRIAAEQDGT
ncbi:MAG TPA: Trm112 family protein, partial [Longimicrobiales bacterium]|nr:Trm112 family protein [Longimicrobiales bacterium]